MISPSWAQCSNDIFAERGQTGCVLVIIFQDWWFIRSAKLTHQSDSIDLTGADSAHIPSLINCDIPRAENRGHLMTDDPPCPWLLTVRNLLGLLWSFSRLCVQTNWSRSSFAAHNWSIIISGPQVPRAAVTDHNSSRHQGSIFCK